MDVLKRLWACGRVALRKCGRRVGVEEEREGEVWDCSVRRAL